MLPKLNNRQVKMMMRKMGMQQSDIEAEEVIIRTKEKEIIIKNPSVVKINMMGQDTFQISGSIREGSRESTPSISEDDIQTVMEQTGSDHDKAENAIKEASGDLAKAILNVKGV